MNISYIGKFTAFVCAAILASCATNPASIRPEPYVVGVERIASLPCWHISKSLNTLGSELSIYYETQNEIIAEAISTMYCCLCNPDWTVGVRLLLAGMPLFRHERQRLVYNDGWTADQIARAKGEILVLKKEFDSRCAGQEGQGAHPE